jgi:alginate O-acetyltransferase complex protein AlgI
MQFTSLAGLVFVALAAIVCRLAPVRLKPAVLVVASYMFYCTWDPSMALALLVASAICYAGALQIEQSRAAGTGSALVAALVAALVLYICWFKLQPLLASGRSVLVPLGISYYTFRLISYVVDVHWGKIRAERDPIRFAAFVAFFPHLVAGPIQRAEEFLPQVGPRRLDWRPQVWRGIARILLGLFKKMAVADPLSGLVGYGFTHAGEGSALPSALALYLFPLQLYMDFAGLTDIAIGVGLLFGIESPENFDRPFAARNISEFWRRWHMSLTNWVRDYVFMSLRMALRDWGKVGLALSLTVNMVLIAIWHGFSTSFLVFGLIQSVYMVADVLTAPLRKKHYKTHPGAARIAGAIGPVVTYHMFAFASVFFLAPTIKAALQVLAGLGAGLSGIAGSLAAALSPPNHHAWSALPFAVAAVLGDRVARRWAPGAHFEPRWRRWSGYAVTGVLCGFVVMIMLTRGQHANPFLYERF